MATSSPPKPWETSAPASTNHSNGNGSAPPAVPPRLASQFATSASTTLPTSAASVSPYGLGSTAGYSSYNRMQPYGSRFGPTYGATGYGGSYGGGYGGYGTYGGGYGSTYGNRFGGGAYGRPYYGDDPSGLGGPNDPLSGLEAGTRSTFQVLEQIVNAFGGFAQMLDSTFQATHASFMAMMGMAEQMGVLRSYLGQVLSVFALARTVRNLAYRATGNRPPVTAGELSADDFSRYQRRSRMSLKPLLVFVLVVVGFPYLMVKLIRRMAERRQRQIDAARATGEGAAEPQLLPSGPAGAVTMNPDQLDFAQALYDFTGEPPVELTFPRGTVIAILSKVDNQGQPSPWWRGRLRSGQTGYFPANYVQLIQKRSPPAPVAAEINAGPPLPAAQAGFDQFVQPAVQHPHQKSAPAAVGMSGLDAALANPTTFDPLAKAMLPEDAAFNPGGKNFSLTA
ncbi:Peroxisomal membrane protein PAS20 [Tieghemiomyces parasiticus]|uniref:Peroxisomal membrane protein PEX13 n=1 Tax=Tieghemiomyces parasiticus TaxID=78921 RepID=A0A9W8AA26_9FUNG|nr:Peroxisomal membrane protein PAS20 [Tieghemiomyces parasiticus]